ncbi:hypothetical protein [Clostridium paraputrificum]|uniref:hypothetical protein n=1 Tax=Clostridium paraputrificum TaxID=29363 RepID=UPI0018A0304E|nr:hypothetical protein [Clostridium paraputrificum]
MLFTRSKERPKRNMFDEGIIRPPDIGISYMCGYEIWGKSEYIKYLMSGGAINKKTIDDRWKRVSKGYNFIIAIYRKDIGSYDLFSVQTFNERLGE